MLNLSFEIKYQDPDTDEEFIETAETKDEAEQIADDLLDAGYKRIKINTLRL